MFSVVTGMIGLIAALVIIVLIRRDHLHVRYGLWWIAVAVAFIVLGFYPQLIDRLAAKLGIAYGPVLALTLGLTVFVIKLLTMDIARSRNETRMVRIVQRMAILESELRRLEGGKPEDQPAPDAPSAEHDPAHGDS